MKSMLRLGLLSVVLSVAACSSGSGGDELADGPTTSRPGGNRSATSRPPTSRPPTNSFHTVSGRVTRRDTGRPYPNAYVRFGWLVSALYERETHAMTDGSGSYAIQLPAGRYQVTAGDSCDLNAAFAIVGRGRDDVMITVPGTSRVDFVEFPLTPGAVIPGDPWCANAR